MTRKTAFLSSPRFVEHLTSPAHPERPDRIRAVYRGLIGSGLLQVDDPFPDFRLDVGLRPGDLKDTQALVPLPFGPADRSHISLIHPPGYFERIERICASGGGILDADTPVGKSSAEIALLALGAVIAGCDAIMAGQVLRAFAAVRPPGHHAEPDRPMGFCLLANLAIAARYLQKHHGVGRIAIVDFDVHHGNGSQASFYDDPSVFFISLHQDPRTIYPGSGFARETGAAGGEGTTLNVPFNPGAGDSEYLHAMEAKVLPALELFDPQMLLISAGFDAHEDDPLADIRLTEAGFAQMTRLLVQLADKHCGGKTLSVLEGGYDLRALARSAAAHVGALI